MAQVKRKWKATPNFYRLTLREFFYYFSKSGEIKQTFNRYVAETFSHSDKTSRTKSTCS